METFALWSGGSMTDILGILGLTFLLAQSLVIFTGFHILEDAWVDYQVDRQLPAVPRRAGVVVRVVRA